MADTTDDVREAIQEAVIEAQATYDDAQKSPVDHGFVMIKGLDGRTRLAQELKKHPQIDVQSGGYHGTTVEIEGLSRYMTAQRGAYDVFIKTLKSLGVDTQDMRVWEHGH